MKTSNQRELERYRGLVNSKVRELRQERQWSQGQLAQKLGLSQSRLSEIERGGGSFTAEQLLLLLRLFNVDVGTFVPNQPKQNEELQNALIRLGARHLRHARHVVATGRFTTAADVIRTVLLDPQSERLLTALAPVLVEHCDSIPFTLLQSDLAQAGRPNRLGWLAENVSKAIDKVAATLPSPTNRPARRAAIVLDELLRHVRPAAMQHDSTRDALDRGIRSKRTLESTWDNASPISKRWNIATSLTVDDFAIALRQASE